MKISKDELDQFSLLLDQGLDTTSMIELCFKESDKMIQYLKEGKSIVDILTKDQKSRYFCLLRILSKKCSFSTSIQCASEIEKSSQSLLKDFLAKTIYPIFIFLFAYFMILFFSNSIVPSMAGFVSDGRSFIVLDILKIIYTFLFCFLCFICIILVLFVFGCRFKEYILKFSDRFSIVRLYKTIHFSIILSYLLNCGMTTKECLELMSEMNQYYFVKEIANEVLELLEKGVSIDKTVEIICFDDSFKKFFAIGLSTSNLNHVLKIYERQALFKFKKAVHQLTISIQLFSYISVGMLVLVVYQVMLVPLNMLNAM